MSKPRGNVAPDDPNPFAGASRTSQVTLRAPSPNEVLDAVLELSRAVTVDMHTDEVVHTHIERFKAVFPERLFCVRLLSPEGGELSMVYATGRLRPDRRDRLELTREALLRHGIVLARPSTERVAIIDGYRPFFVGGVTGFDVPMMDGDQLAGVLLVEYAAGAAPPEDDRPLIVQLALQLGSALRNSRLHRESVYLRDYLSKLLDYANAPIMVMGRDGDVTFANRAFLTLTGVTREEVMGKDWFGLLPETERRRLLPYYISALHGEPSTNVEVRLPRRDGSFAQVAVNIASISSPDGDVESVIYIYRDVSELRELETQVIHAEKLATLGQLAAGVVHELNNPLTSILVYADYLHKKAAREGAQGADIEKLRRIVEGAERILKFTRDLVSYARPATETPVSTDIHELLDQAVVFCEHLIEETGAEIDRRYGQSLAPIYVVKGQLVQVFVNLITNACHAMPPGTGRLTLATAASGEGRLSVRVIDSGKGISPENLQRVFEPFFTTKGEGKGTGLGLSIVKNIVEQHRGTIAVRSEVGVGTTFEVTLACRSDARE